MKIFKIVLVGALGFSGYIGYQNFGVDLSDLTSVIAPVQEERVATKKSKPKVSRSRPEAMENARERTRPSPAEKPEEKDETDYIDLIIKLGETISPLLIPYLASKRKKKEPDGHIRTLDDDIGDVATRMGVPKSFIRGKLGLGDRRKAQARTKRKRRSTD